jgi:hypothetical protein
MDREEVRAYVERSEDIIDEAPQMGETNTKEMLVRRFIRVLGWEFHPSEVKLEYPVRMASTRTKVDYALMIEDTPVVFVEAKGLDTPLSDDHRKQITSYMHNEEGVEWGLLTNGEEYEFFRYDGTPSGFSLDALELDELSENIEVVEMLSKELVDSEESKARADRLREHRRAVSKLRNDKDEIADDITEVVTESVGESVASATETEAKEFVDRVVEELENGEGTTVSRQPKGSRVKSASEETAVDRRDDVVLAAEGEAVASFSGGSQSDAMAKAVEYLIENHALLEKVSLPYVPGKKYAILNDVPKDAEGNEMRLYRQVSDIYVSTSMNKAQKERNIGRLVEKCGLSAEFNW